MIQVIYVILGSLYLFGRQLIVTQGHLKYLTIQVNILQY